MLNTSYQQRAGSRENTNLYAHPYIEPLILEVKNTQMFAAV